MDYTMYFTTVADHQRYLPPTDGYSPDGGYEDIKPIMVRESGSDSFLRGADGQITVSNRNYKTVTRIRPKDLINGQVVLDVKTIRDFDGTIMHYKAFV